ncbi:MAG TPA: hypothetical protein VHO69_17125, partial [Phototrophicaceae bacterium]|nr:hypothetical protein [Phototrophicaceae bacterium]
MSDNQQQPEDERERFSRLAKATQENDVVREYEERYYEPRKPKAKPRSYSTMNLTDEERQWAAVAHASIWLT